MASDVVLADHGFTIQDTVKQLYYAELNLPALQKV